jgi:hypothetical protein
MHGYISCLQLVRLEGNIANWLSNNVQMIVVQTWIQMQHWNGDTTMRRTLSEFIFHYLEVRTNVYATFRSNRNAHMTSSQLQYEEDCRVLNWKTGGMARHQAGEGWVRLQAGISNQSRSGTMTWPPSLTPPLPAEPDARASDSPMLSAYSAPLLFRPSAPAPAGKGDGSDTKKS